MPHTARILGHFAVSVCVGALALEVMAGGLIAQAAPTLAPVHNEGLPNQIPGRYIVVFQQGTPPNAVAAAADRILALGGTVQLKYTTGAPGFVFSFNVTTLRSQAQMAVQELQALQGVAYLEAEQSASLQAVQMPAPMGLDRIDQRMGSLDKTFHHTETGKGVDVYVIDSGVFTDHSDFGGRATSDYSAACPDSLTTCTAAERGDCTGHGTHVAGIIGGTRFGVAKEVRIRSVRASDAGCVTTPGTIKAAVEWVTAQHLVNPTTPAVANISLAVHTSLTLDNAVRDSIKAGVTYVVAAGNGDPAKGPLGVDACGWSPAGVPEAITVGATHPASDDRQFFSNFGACLDIFAPGVAIESTTPDGRVFRRCNQDSTTSSTVGSQTAICNGTSQAAPHVAGCAALHLQNFPKDAPASVWARLHAVANVSGTMAGGMMWPGIQMPEPGDPNVLLHCGSRNNLMDD